MNSDYMDIAIEDTMINPTECEPVNEIVNLNLIRFASTAITFLVIKGILSKINSDKKEEIRKAVRNYEEEHENDLDFIKGSKFKISRYSLKYNILDDSELSKENDKIGKKDSIFLKIIDKLPSAHQKEFFKRAKYNNNAMVFLKDNLIYYYVIYKEVSQAVRSITYVSTSNETDKHANYYTAYACLHIGYVSDRVYKWAKIYNNEFYKEKE